MQQDQTQDQQVAIIAQQLHKLIQQQEENFTSKQDDYKDFFHRVCYTLKEWEDQYQSNFNELQKDGLSIELLQVEAQLKTIQELKENLQWDTGCDIDKHSLKKTE